ncbi:SpoIIE family protein phosphatase [Pseudomonas alliivorans]|uniref:SpoIIE family protein phosphatase n=1 Tax=Pseudomonas alliivorans TaxID=2810613 RepID=A0ABS4CAK8_9PSED|nr:SpoIIE family protein phosphatase [Pseudomonas alliivorans]MBP0940619.1 SpoIIE family protein phosphatase [Pseudomonas alliivorans]MBP0947384.1 SpoIIE family protein phosphatase [Pseudomonas alliivorans]MCO5368222.1 SpoIIE family protein phosphatase [Pseudomonas alliivorans]MEE4326977.1 SpoIIE family protein phosphatase [Pseudomonas alliivorans]MEE4335528.1 SpoIIE family protein phosphatase [Pseudomonas alliivorans]
MQALSKGLCILIADDSASDRLLLATIIARLGHRVVSAANGLEAVAIFSTERPHLVLMDAMMPLMDGFEAARRIKLMAGESLVPIIFLTSLTEGEALARCLDAGGDDFVSKPYNTQVLAAKINAMNRLRLLQETVLQQRDLISTHHEYLLNEQRVAKAVFDQVAHSGCLGAANIRYLQSPYALFNGDLMLAAYTPAGHMHVLLGDFTGHGLPAAVGAMPLADVFYGMTAKGFGLVEILREMNAKLKRILPVDMFCCATLLCVNLSQRQVEVWNGGLPDGYLLRADGAEPVILVSRHLPLGVLSVDAFEVRTDVYPLALGDRIFLLSDGVLDTSDSHDQLFGVQRLRDVLAANEQPAFLIQEILQALNDFGGKARDDVSLLEITVIDEPLDPLPLPTYSDSGASSPLDWSASFEFRGSTLKRFNPVPYVLQLLLEVHGLRSQGGALHAVMGELYSNALEHGVLGLDSALKHDAAGFARYYELRAERLENLRDGFIRMTLRIEPVGQGGRLTLSVEDSGNGFDAQQVIDHTPAIDGLYGRGIRLVCELSRQARWSTDGRIACVEFSWT